jgi:MoxR-like ATPase
MSTTETAVKKTNGVAIKAPSMLKNKSAQAETGKETPAPAEAPAAAPKTKSDPTKFVFMEDLNKALDLALLTGENIILFGKGGHGKSEFTEYFFESKGIEPFVKTMGSGTTTDSLFGGIDIKKFNDTGALEFLVENSFMNFEYVIFEELMDAPDYILEQLKDILTSGKFRNGTQVFEIKTKLIVCCTNKTREEFTKNDSLKALMERFPLEYKVEWNAYTKDTYSFMFNKMFGKPFSQLSYIMEKLAQNGTVVSPRTAIKAARILEKTGGDMGGLKFMADFSGKNKSLVDAEISKYKNVQVIEDLIAKIDGNIKEANSVTLNSLDNVRRAKVVLKEIHADIQTLKAKKVDDELMKQISGRVSGYEKFLQSKLKEIQDVIEK